MAPRMDAKASRIVREACEATKWRCFNDEGELDLDQWFTETDELLYEEYSDHEDEIYEGARTLLIRQVQRTMRSNSRKRVYQYLEGTGEDGEDGIPDLPTEESLKGEMVTVPKPDGQKVPKLLIMCNTSEVSAVVSMFSRIASQNGARRRRYEVLLFHMRERGFRDDKRVKDLY